MTFAEKFKEAKKLTVIFAVAAGITTGGVIGGAYVYNNDAAARIELPESVRLQIPKDYKTVIEADVLQVASDGTAVVRAHPWVGQYLISGVAQVGGSVDAPLTANITDKDGNTVRPKAGDKVYLRGVQGRGTTGMKVDIPVTRPTGDILEGPVQARVIRVIDGDTPAVIAQVWPGHYVSISIRVGGIDTPEKKGRAKNAWEAQQAELASQATRELIEDKEVLLYNLQYEKFGGRMLGDVKTLDGTDVAQNLISKGLARAYDGGTKEDWNPPPGWKAPTPEKKPKKPAR